MRILCPHCHAEESRCPEVLPACRAAGIELRRIYAAANGSEVEALRAENEALRAENEALRAALAKHARVRVDPVLDTARAPGVGS